MASQNSLEKAGTSAVSELANTKELGPYWTNLSVSRRDSSQSTFTPINTNSSNSSKNQTTHSKGSEQKSRRNKKKAAKSNTLKREESQDGNPVSEEVGNSEVIMSSNSKTRLPKAAATYDLGIQDPELRQEIDASLLHNGHIATYVFPPPQFISRHY